LDRSRNLVAELIGTALLLFVVVGSGIATERLGGDGAGQLLAHAIVVGLGLAASIAFLGPVSGAHFNPAVTLGFWRAGSIGLGFGAAYVGVQVAGAVAGVIVANVTFGEPAWTISTTERAGAGILGSEFVVTFVLVLLILGLVRSANLPAVAPAVGAWVAAAIFGSSSTGFANPAVTLARIGTDTYTGIAPASIPGFIGVQLIAGVAAAALAVFLYPAKPSSAKRSSSVTTGKPAVLYVCVHNAGRSQMAAGWTRHLGGDAVEVFSGGSEPGDQVNPAAVAAMAEVGIDISDQSPRLWTEAAVWSADAVITMGCGDVCPVFPGKRYEDWELEDPAGQGLEAVRPIRDEIEQRVRTLLNELGVAARG
jgi:arsenate reductase